MRRILCLVGGALLFWGSMSESVAAGLGDLSATVTSSFYTNTQVIGSEQDDSSLDLSTGLKYKLDDDLSLKASTSFGRGLKKYDEWEFTSDTKAGISYGSHKINRTFSYTLSLNAYFPTTENSRVYKESVLGIEIENAFSAKLQSILKGLSASYRIRTAFNSYRTNVDFNGRSNTPYKIVQIATLGYSPTDWIDFSFLAAFVNAWSYEYNSFESFKFAEEISTTVTDEISLAVGHEHGGGVLKADGRTSNLEFFDSNDSQFYLSLTVSL